MSNSEDQNLDLDDIEVGPYDIPDNIASATGRIVMGVAEIDELLSLRIMDLANLEQRFGNILLGRLVISAKLNKIALLRKVNPDKATDDFEHLSEAITSVNRLRNAFAHGHYIGQVVSDGGLVFAERANFEEPIDGQHAHRCIVFTEEKILKIAEAVPRLILLIRADWGMLGELRLGQLKPRPPKGRNRPKSRPDKTP